MKLWVLIYVYMRLAPGNENGMNENLSGFTMRAPVAQIFVDESSCAVARERWAAYMNAHGVHLDNSATLTCTESYVMEIKRQEQPAPTAAPAPLADVSAEALKAELDRRAAAQRCKSLDSPAERRECQ